MKETLKGEWRNETEKERKPTEGGCRGGWQELTLTEELREPVWTHALELSRLKDKLEYL